MTLLLKPEEAATELGIARRRLFALLKDGTIPSVKIGVSRRIRYSDLVAYVESLPADVTPGDAA